MAELPDRRDLARQQCQPQGKDGGLDAQKAANLLNDLPGWSLEGDAITKTYQFDNYHQAVAFVNATAWVSHRQDHHPDLEVGYNKVTVRYSTHSVGGVSINDFICAAKLESLMEL